MTVHARFRFSWILVLGSIFSASSAWVQAAETESIASNPESNSESVFDLTRVWSIQIHLDRDEFEAIQPRHPWALGIPLDSVNSDPNREMHRNQFGMDLPWGKGTVVIAGKTYTNVGIRYKGNGTVMETSHMIKKSLKIDFDRFGESSRFNGLKMVNLHCGVTDPSKCRESLGYALYRSAAVPAPRTALAEVRLHVEGMFDNELLGVYTLVEELDSSFLRDNFGTKKGLLLKPEGVRDFEFRGFHWSAYEANYRPKNPPSESEQRRVLEFVRLVDQSSDEEFEKQIGSYLEISTYLRFLATTAFVSNADSFFAAGHNYCVYLHPETGQFHFLPWDLDRAFANFPFFCSNDQLMDLNVEHPYPGPHRLTERLLAIPKIKAEYWSLLRVLQATAWDRERLLSQLEALETRLKPLLAEERKVDAIRNELAPAFGPMFPKPPSMRVFFDRRLSSLVSQTSGKSTGYTP